MLTKHPVESKRISDKEHIPMVGRRSVLFHPHLSKTQKLTFFMTVNMPVDQ